MTIESQRLLSSLVSTSEHPIVQEFSSYLERKDLSHNYKNNIFTIVRDFLGQSDYILTEQTIYEYLRCKNQKSLYFGYIKKYAEFLYKEKLIMDDFTYRRLTELKYKNKSPQRTHYIEKDNVEIDIKYKWKVRKEDWEYCYSQLSFEPQRLSLWLGFNFGLRCGEIISLKWPSINFKTGIIKIRESEPDAWDVKGFKPKTKSSIREIKMTPTQKRILESYKENWKKLNLTHNYVIYIPKGKSKGLPVTNGGTLWRWCKKVIVEIEVEGYSILKKLRPHVLRYSFASNIWRSSGVNGIFTLSKVLGHSDIKITQSYLVISEKELQKDILELQLLAGL